ncbi:uncharacterized protein [Diadema antillarum]|uniref:uncharacterized protein n=1 Tax=Diadema antillarum TaxID=105358 RepID=UPI003A8641EA
MGDQGLTNPQFNSRVRALRETLLLKAVENWDTLTEENQEEIANMGNFFGKMHLLVNFATEADMVSKINEADVVAEGKNPYPLCILEQQGNKKGYFKDIENKPAQIYNVDETGLPLDPSKLKVIAEKGAKNVFRIIGGSGRETTTVQGCGSASGHVFPPYVVYSGKNLYNEWTMGGAQNARYTTSSNGWMEGDTFYDWLQNTFIPNIPDIRPVQLIFDGHASHITFPLVQLAVRNNITILRLPSYTTHYLQPLDMGVYGPVKAAWEKILVQYARLNLGRALLKDEFPKLVKQLWDVAMKSDSLRSGFRSCGIVPFDPSVIPESRYEASAALKPQVGPPQQPHKTEVHLHLQVPQDYLHHKQSIMLVRWKQQMERMERLSQGLLPLLMTHLLCHLQLQHRLQLQQHLQL